MDLHSKPMAKKIVTVRKRPRAKLNPRQARAMSRKRKTFGGGRPRKPTPCPKCGAMCPGHRLALVHCAVL